MIRPAARHRKTDRSGVCAVEFAFIGPVLVMLLIGMTFIGLATFRYVQLANVSRQAARWAAVHGKRYSAVTGMPPITSNDVYQSAIKPAMIATDPDKLKWSVAWSADGSMVTVSLEYTESPEAYFVGGTLSSQCIMFIVN